MHRTRLIWIAGVAGVVFAASVAVFAWQLSAAGRFGGGDAQPEPRVEVLSCAAAINAGDRITDLNAVVVGVPKSLVPDGAVLGGDLQQVRGRRVSARMSRGEILTKVRLQGEPSPLDSVSEDHVAVTVAVDPVRALGGEISPGMCVNVMVEAESGTVITIAPSIRVMSTSVREQGEQEPSLMSAGGAGPEIAWVTLEVPCESVDAVVAASTAGSVYLVLPFSSVRGSRG